VNASIAVSGNKQINIRANWQEKVILWIAGICRSGSGKTPFTYQRGRSILKSIQRQSQEQHKQELEQSKNQEINKTRKLIRKRLLADGLTISTVM
jgi:hypothetical protein